VVVDNLVESEVDSMGYMDCNNQVAVVEDNSDNLEEMSFDVEFA
jgi:hypothetical protein